MVRISLKRSQKPQKQGIESVISEILHFSGVRGEVELKIRKQDFIPKNTEIHTKAYNSMCAEARRETDLWN